MSISADIKTTETQVKTYLSAHHVLLYVFLVVALLVGVYLFESKDAELQKSRADAAQQALAAEKDHSAQLLSVFTAAQAQRDKDNAAAFQSISQAKSNSKVQIVHDQALPAPALGHRIETITGFKQNTITLDPSQDLIVPLPLATDIVSRLDQAMADAQTVQSQDTVIKNQTATIGDQTQIIANDKTILADQIKTDTKVLNSCKADARKGKLKWFSIGYVAGFISREIIKP